MTVDTDVHSGELPAGGLPMLGEPLWPLTSGQLCERLDAVTRLRAQLAAEHARTLAELTTRETAVAAHPTRWVHERDGSPVGPLLSRAEAGRLVRRAQATTTLPLLSSLLAVGEISTEILDRAALGVRALPAEAAPDVDRLLADTAARLRPEDITTVLGRVRALLDPDGADRDGARADARSGLHLSPVGATWTLSATLGAFEGAELHAALAQHSRPTSSLDTRTAPRRRLDALLDLLRRGLTAAPDSGSGTPRGAAAHLVVLTTPAALARQPGAPAAVTADGTLLDPGTLAALACDSPTTVLTHAPPGEPPAADDADRNAWLLREAHTGLLPPPLAPPLHVLSLGRTTRCASTAQWLALVARDGTCRYPHCRRGPQQCQAHHLAEWTADRGPTDLANLALVCWTHHVRLHRRGEHLRLRPDGTGELLHHRAWHELQDPPTS